MTGAPAGQRQGCRGPVDPVRSHFASGEPLAGLERFPHDG